MFNPNYSAFWKLMDQDKKKLGVALHFQYGTSIITLFGPSPHVSRYFLYQITPTPHPPFPPPPPPQKKYGSTDSLSESFSLTKTMEMR